jgi:hypothetical protein
VALREIRKRSGSEAETSINNLDLEDILCRIRSVMETLSSSEKIKESLERMYGTNVFKCLWIDCTGFFDGLDECRQHQKRHVRRFYCTFKGCVAAELGFGSSSELQPHSQRLHDPTEVPSFPRYQSPTMSDVERAIDRPISLSSNGLCRLSGRVSRSCLGIVSHSRSGLCGGEQSYVPMMKFSIFSFVKPNFRGPTFSA